MSLQKTLSDLLAAKLLYAYHSNNKINNEKFILSLKGLPVLSIGLKLYLYIIFSISYMPGFTFMHS